MPPQGTSAGLVRCRQLLVAGIARRHGVVACHPGTVLENLGVPLVRHVCVGVSALLACCGRGNGVFFRRQGAIRTQGRGQEGRGQRGTTLQRRCKEENRVWFTHLSTHSFHLLG